MTEYTLYSYWRSSASYRVRIALALKGIDYKYIAINLVKGEHRSESYKLLNPSGLVPTLMIDDEGLLLTQSLAIIEYLDEIEIGGAPLLPRDPILRAKAREIACVLACDVHPRQNLRVLMEIEDETRRADQARIVIGEGLSVVEALISNTTTSSYCVGEGVSIADVVLVPQVYNARRWGVDMAAFPKINAIVSHLESLPPFLHAHPDSQPDKPQ